MSTTESTTSVTGRSAASRILAAWHQTGRADLESHLSTHGSVPFPRRVDDAWGDRLVHCVDAAGLTGRGGAGFPTARKLESSRSGYRPALLVVNAMEGEPASQKDRALLSGAPHLVLDGADLVATAIGAREIAVCVGDDCADNAEGVRVAMLERASAGLHRISTRLVLAPGRYVTGEESALVAWLAGGPAHPQFRTDKATPLTIKRKAVLVQSAETLAHVALIARYGPEWFRSVGLPDAPGTCLVTVSGPGVKPGVCEVELGTPVARILQRAGISTPLEAVLVGGYGGAWIRPGLLGTPYAPKPLSAVGSAVGAGVIAAIAPSSCGIAETAGVATYMANESVGQCGPCVFGLHAIVEDLIQLARGECDSQILNRLTHRLGAVDGRGACAHPDGVVRFVRSALEVFADDVFAHARHRPCAAWNLRPILPVSQSASVAVGRWR